MIQTNQPVHRDGQLRRAERPAFFQQQVVDVLQADAGVLAENVERIEHFLQIHQPDFPRAPLLLNNRLERVSGRAMAAAGFEEDEISLFCPTSVCQRVRVK